jgi:hypothetical protein
MASRPGLPPLGDSPTGWVMPCRGRGVRPARALHTTRVFAERQTQNRTKGVRQKPKRTPPSAAEIAVSNQVAAKVLRLSLR